MTGNPGETIRTRKMSMHPPRDLALNKPRWNRIASSKLSDTTNGEASSAVHQNVLASESEFMRVLSARRVKSCSFISVATSILGLIKKMCKLSALLSETVREATDADDIYRVITKVHGIDDTIAGTFNRGHFTHKCFILPSGGNVLFTHVYNAYKKVYNDEWAHSAATATRSHPRPPPGSTAAFLDDVCMVDSDDEMGTVSELEQFLLPSIRMAVGSGTLRYYGERNSSIISQLSRIWPAISWPFREPVSRLNGCSRGHVTYAMRLGGP
ncbi:hypothetical protein C8R44DRAFT_883665 [Mycena epipterygia]|nr:hypothetical protein C8R44DRAFT_883665 [Mycena epipterygia]